MRRHDKFSRVYVIRALGKEFVEISYSCTTTSTASLRTHIYDCAIMLHTASSIEVFLADVRERRDDEQKKSRVSLYTSMKGKTREMCVLVQGHFFLLLYDDFTVFRKRRRSNRTLFASTKTRINASRIWQTRLHDLLAMVVIFFVFTILFVDLTKRNCKSFIIFIPRIT